MLSFAEKFAPYAEIMQAARLPKAAIKSFEYYYCQLVNGKTGLIPEPSINPVTSLPDVETFANDLAEVGQKALCKTVSIKLNGGLGTSMGMEKAKSLLIVKNNLSFLDIVVQHARKNGIPLVLMNSFVTHEDTLVALSQYSELWSEVPQTFQQHKVPKVTRTDLSPAFWPKNRRLEWCPPGHGDIYASLVTSRTLDKLLDAGYEYAFVSNVDNLGAVIDKAILGYFVENHIPFMMEVADRTQADKKGGHLARRLSGRLVLREVAQCPSSELDAFQDTTRHKYFNTNNLWLSLPAVRDIMASVGNVLKLPMICNVKTIDPRDNTSTEVYQLETAMASAIELFEGAEAVRVPRIRFSPVKTSEDLLRIRSDLYNLTDDFRIVPNQCRNLGDIVINLDPTYYGVIDSMEARFPYGAPSLIDCAQIEVKGDIRFGRNVVLRGCVDLVNELKQQLVIEDGAMING
jgi:UTP--glucose-1-phosphate uridylyltransferase